jgi:hypothetical protein
MAQLPSGEAVVAAPNKKTRELIGRLAAAALVAFALFLFASGFADHKSKPVGGLPPGIESVSPENLSTNVPKQSTVAVDLEFGYTGILTITGKEQPTEIPLDQLDYVRSTGMLSFSPGDAKEFNSLPGDAVRVTVTYWPEAKTRQTAGKEFTWTFNVL